MGFQIVQALLTSGPALFANAIEQSNYIANLDTAEEFQFIETSETRHDRSTAYGIVGAVVTIVCYTFLKVIDKFPPSTLRPRPGLLIEFFMLSSALGVIGICAKIININDIWQKRSADFNTTKKAQTAALDIAIFIATGSLGVIGCLAADKLIKKLV